MKFVGGTILVLFLVFVAVSASGSHNRRPIEINNLALAGGGVFGPAHIGVFSVLESKSNFVPKSIVGTSIGSLLGSLIAVGYSSAELQYIFVREVPAANRSDTELIGTTMLNNFGMLSGDVIGPQVDYLLYLKSGNPSMTLAQLAAHRGIQFTAVSYNVNKKRLEYFNNVTEPNMKVSLAVQLSSSVPILYTSPLYKGCRYVDGGVREVNPVKFFTDDKKHTLASDFVPHYNVSSVRNVEDFASDMLVLMQENNLPKFGNSWEKRIIKSSMPVGIRDTEVSISLPQAQAIFAAGQTAANNFFDNSSPFLED